MKLKRLVVNALAYKENSSGIGVMLRELCSAYSRVSGRPCQVIIPKDSPDFPVGDRTELLRVPWDHSQNLWRILFQTFGLGRTYCRGAVLLTSDSKCPFFLPKDCTLLPLVTDLAVYRMPEVYRLSRVLLWRLQYRYVRRRADRFLTISEFTKSEMVKLWKTPPEKIDIVPCACSDMLHQVKEAQQLRAVKEKYHLPEQFVLFVGNSNPRKNLDRLIRAFTAAKAQKGFPHRLIIAGEQGWKFNRDKAVQGCENSEDIRFIGFVPDEDMAPLYSAAAMFAFPTLYEGFGIPVIEAQRCGTPVLTSSVSALPEVGGDAAVYVDPYREEDIARGIAEILTNDILRLEMIRKGFQNAERFSWEASAQKLNQIVEGIFTQ